MINLNYNWNHSRGDSIASFAVGGKITFTENYKKPFREEDTWFMQAIDSIQVRLWLSRSGSNLYPCAILDLITYPEGCYTYANDEFGFSS